MKGNVRQVGERSWQFRVGGGKDPATGRYRTHTKIWAGGNSRADQRERAAALVEFIQEVQLGRGLGGTAQPFRALLTRWLDTAEGKLSPTTLYTYRGYITREIEPVIGDVAIGKLTAEHLDMLYADMLEDGCARATVRQVHSICRKALDQARKWGWVPVNVATLASPPPARRTEIHPPTPDVVALLIRSAHEIDPAFGTILDVAAETSARRGELCALRWPDLDLEANSMRIARAIIEIQGKVTEKDTKTHAERRISISPDLAADLQAHQARLAQRAREHGTELDPAGFVFPGTHRHASLSGSTPTRPSQLTAQFRALCANHGVKARFHDLRHMGATQLIAGGTDVRTVSGRLGHAQTSTTLNIYTHWVPKADQDAAAAMGRSLRKGRTAALPPADEAG